MYKEQKHCIVCGETGILTQVFDLGTQYVIDFVKQKDERLLQAPLTLMKCDYCHLVQLKHKVDPDRLYTKMWYRSSINKQMQDELLAIVQKAQRTVELKAGDKVLDIGCNDGTLLGWYDKGVVTVGVDPCVERIQEGLNEKRIDVAIPGYFSADTIIATCKTMGIPQMKFKIITAIAMFYDLDNPVEFLKDCKQVLHEDGVLVIQMNYLKTMLQTTGFDNISHEHLAYYSVFTLQEVINRAGLEFQGLEISKSNGGSLRAYVTHKEFKNFCASDPSDRLWLATNISMKIMEEIKLGLATKAIYEDFGVRVESKMKVLKTHLTKLAKDNKLYAYGASTRGTSLVQYLFKDGGSEIIRGVAERDELKYGLKMVGTWWPIIPEAEARANCKHMLVLPWHFRDSISTREQEWLVAGGNLIFPLPSPGIVTAEELLTSEKALA